MSGKKNHEIVSSFTAEKRTGGSNTLWWLRCIFLQQFCQQKHDKERRRERKDNFDTEDDVFEWEEEKLKCYDEERKDAAVDDAFGGEEVTQEDNTKKEVSRVPE